MEFGFFNALRIGFPIYSQEYNTTYAILTSIDYDSTVNITTIESKLTVMVSSNGSISCKDDENTVFKVSIIASK